MPHALVTTKLRAPGTRPDLVERPRLRKARDEGRRLTLEEVTEGWIAALQLAALSMRDREDASGFVESFSESNRHVLDL